ncbi:MAG: VWA domain-containing protein [Verrucomicrobia subdivision 3 bacterium]|nr:VWA domain-containing protein [Limisphaerales bacterium]
MTTALQITLAALLLTGLAEWLHVRRCRRVARLAFGPGGGPREWTKVAPWLRMAALGALTWGFLTLLQIGPQSVRREEFVPAGGFRHLVIALDVSPSMQLADAGLNGKQTRALRAGEVLMSLLQRTALDQVHVSIIAFYSGAKPVVVDTADMEVVRNCLNDLPLDIAFNVGQTELLEGVRQSVELAKTWQPDSATLVIVSDGDTLPDSGMPQMPRSIHRTLVVGVGDALAGKYIDGHQSRQDATTLRQLAARLKGDYFDANQKHLPSATLAMLSKSLPLRDTRERGLREAALLCIGFGSFLLAALPVALAFAGSGWQAGVRSRSPSFVPTFKLNSRLTAANPQPEKTTYA